ncbi:MAG: DnaT-like ssDNA-binding protein [Campylobacterota bacterium]|nr:DnaT-like ssDNA-binding protein [Campylobacterota bacterium]
MIWRCIILEEDGSGLADADTYANVQTVDNYHTKLLNTAWTDITDNLVKESHIYKAMNYLESVFGFQWVGEPLLPDTQALSMPRLYNGLTLYPKELKNAVCELALESVNLNGEPLMTNTAQRVKKEKVSSIEVEYSEYSSEITQYTTVYQLLNPYVESSSSYEHRVSR